jgi:hypothetical protein
LIIRRVWAELPDEVRRAVERRCGRVLDVNPATAGRHSEFSATLGTVGGGRVFVKGITMDHPQAGGHRHEMYVNPWLPDVAPRLLWTVEAGGWLMLGFEYLSGRHANLAPGSDDLPMITDAVSAMAEALHPCPARSAPVLAEQWVRFAAWRRLRQNPPADLHPWSRANLDRFVTWERRAVESVQGNGLAHTDLHPLNMIVDRSARVVDWAWSRRAAGWVDTGFLVPRLIQSGHTPGDAEQWAAENPAWSEASETDRTAFAVGVLGLWEFLQRDQPLPHRPRLTDAARRWAEHRLNPS